MKHLAILGASGHGRVIADTAECCGWDRISFFDDAWPHRTENGTWQVIGTSYDLLNSLKDFDGIVVGIGSNAIRQKKQSQIASAGGMLATIIHPSAVVSQYAAIGIGSVVFAGAVVNAGARIGNGVILNTSCTIDHDCVLGDFSHISPGANLAGTVQIGQRSWVGIGACIRHMIHIGDDVMIGAGAAVVNNIDNQLTVAGVPARPIKRYQPTK